MMKKIIFFLFGFCIIISFYAQGQERVDEARKQLSISIDGQSEKITKIPGWSKLETQEGKFWKQSDTTSIKSYLPCCPEETGFEYLQLYKFTVEGQSCYLFLIKYKDDKMRLFAFKNSGLSELQTIVNKADGQSYNAIEIMFCQYLADKEARSFDPEVAIKNKEMIRWLLLGKGEYYSNDCKGARLFNVQSQVLKGEPIVRFNILPWRGSQGNFSPNIIGNYFELSKQNFEKLYRFTPYENELSYQKQGREKYNLKDYKGAISEYSGAIKLNPTNPANYNLSGNAKYSLGDYAGALNDYSKAVELCPKEKDYDFPIQPDVISTYYNNRGITKVILKDYNGAIEDFLKSYNFSMNQTALWESGKAKYYLGDYKGALDDINRAASISSKIINDNFYFWRANIWFEMKNFGGALADISQAIELNPKDANLYTFRALAYIEQMDYNSAISDCSKALEIDPNHGEALNNRGLAKIKLGEKESGCTDLNKAVEAGYEKAKMLIDQYCK